MAWKSKIVGHGRVAPGSIRLNPLNYRRHPDKQTQALADAIAALGFLKSVLINKRTGNLIDGHARVEEALKAGAALVDVEYVDLSPEEEAQALATLDPIGELATVDPRVAAMRQQHAALGKLLRQVQDKGAPRDERQSQRELMARKRAAEREIEIPRVADPARRARCLADPIDFLSTYFPSAYFHPFTADQRRMIAELVHCARHGGDLAIAAPRGDGKTTSALRVLIYAVLNGWVTFGLLIAATDHDAHSLLGAVKHEFETNDLVAADFPEVCARIRALGGSPGRARLQTHRGERTLIDWSDKIAILPTIAGSPASGAILMGRGLTSAFRGLLRRRRSPDFVLVDDPETRASAASEYQVAIREQTLDRDVAGLAGPGKKITRAVLCTLQNRRCLAAKLTDRKQKPAFQGRRYKQVIAWPERDDLWEEYCALRRRGKELGDDPDRLVANAFYLADRETRDRGAEVSNPYRFVSTPLGDGSQAEVSAIQHCFNLIADRGMDAFLTELQNDPPEEEGPETSGHTASLIEDRVNGWPQERVPAETIALTGAIDLGKYGCHWVAIAWLPRAIGLVIDYGVLEVYGTIRQQDGPTVDAAVHAALHRWRHETLAAPFLDPAGEAVPFDLVMIDSGDFTGAAYQFVRDAGGMPFVVSKGIGGQSTQEPTMTTPATAATAAKPEAPARKPATMKELKAKFKHAPAEFLVAQIEAEATIEEAMAAWNELLESRLRESEKQVKALKGSKAADGKNAAKNKAKAKAKAKNEDDEEPENEDGEEPENEDGEEPEAVVRRFNARIRKAMRARNLSLMQATRAVCKENPRLHQKFLLATNDRPGRSAQAKTRALIVDRFEEARLMRAGVFRKKIAKK